MCNVAEPVAAACIGQVYKAKLPGVGDEAVKVQRPGVRRLVSLIFTLILIHKNECQPMCTYVILPICNIKETQSYS